LFQPFKQQLKSLAALNTMEYENQFIQSQGQRLFVFWLGFRRGLTLHMHSVYCEGYHLEWNIGLVGNRHLEGSLLYIRAVCIVKLSIYSGT